jgi:hypothetical protein
MKNRFFLWVAACLVLLLGISFSVPAKSADIDRLGYTEADQEFYLPEALFVLIQPGVEADVLSVEIPGDRRAEVVFTVTDPGGDSLIPNGEDCTRAVNTRFLLTHIPAGEQNKVGYIGGSRYEDGTPRRGGTITDQGDGTWLFKFDTVLPEGYDADATTTLGLAARRDLRNCIEGYDLGREAKSVIVNFVPSGNGEPAPRDIVSTESCNRCHNPIAMHGENYPEVQMCTQCHNPGLYSDEYGLSYEFSAMIHRVHSSQEPQLGTVHYPAPISDCQVCHTGGTPTVDRSGAKPSAARPLAASPNPITACGTGVGMTTLTWSADGNVEVRINSATGPLFAQGGPSGSQATGEWVTDGMDFFLLDRDSGAFLQKTNVDLTVFGCVDNAPYDHTAYIGDPAALHSAWMTRPNREACGGCHTYIDWETGEGHPGGPAEDDEFCSFCHQADSGNEFDRSVAGAHTQPLASSVMTGVLVTIKEVSNTGPGQSPTVLFSLADEKGPLDPSALQTFTLTLNGPNDDFEVNIRENALGKVTPVGSDWSYTFAAKIPSDAEGSYSVGYEGRITREVGKPDPVTGEKPERRDSAENALFAVAVTDSEPQARRLIVDDAKCEACHSNLSLHGDNRKNATEYCQTCHMPNATDEEVRLEGEDVSIHFKYMIHKIHRGAQLENLPYIVYGYRSSVHDYSDVHFPGDLRDCAACHEGTTYNLPLPEGALPTHDPSSYLVDMGPETATCLSCHDGLSAASHASANTGDLGESCSTCHGAGKTYSVERVHAR